jgi:hypothetical protein
MNSEAGILCMELFSNCKKNCDWIELGPEELRYTTSTLRILAQLTPAQTKHWTSGRRRSRRNFADDICSVAEDSARDCYVN